MDPVTGTLVSTLVKLGAGAASGSLNALLNKKLVRMRVAWATAPVARQQGIHVARGTLFRWLGRDDVKAQLAAGGATSIESVIKSLAWLLPGDAMQRERRAAAVLGIILNEYQRAQSPQSATVLDTNWTESRISAESEQTRDLILGQSGAILDALQGADILARDLAKLHPWRRAAAEDLAEMWPALADYVHVLVSKEARGLVLREWANRPPSRFDTAPAEAWCWFGLVAADYGQRHAAISLIQRGISLGAVPANYWWSRSALFLSEDGEGDPVQVRELATRYGPMHPLAAAHVAVLEGEFAAGEKALDTWATDDPNDKAIKAILLSICVAGQDDLNRAISILLEASNSDRQASGPMLRAAENLLYRGFNGVSDNRFEDFQHAESLATKARDSRRLWEGDSVAAILVAIKAAVLSTDVNKAWRLTQGPPDGEATNEEASDPRLRRETAILAATMGNYEVARRVAAELGDPYVTASVQAWTAYGHDDNAGAAAAWLEAWEVASDDYELVQAASALAPLGAGLPDLEELGKRQPESVAKIQNVHNVMSAPEDKLTILRARAHESIQLTVLLDEHLASAGQPAEAALALENGANRWNHPLLMRMAANRHLQAGQYAKAVRAAETALTMGGPNWAGEMDALMVRFDALSAQGLSTEAIQVARRMISVAPESINIRWVLVHSLLRSGDARGAWGALNYKGEPIQPRDAQDARTWIGLAAAHDVSPFFVSRALKIMRVWVDDVELVGTFLAQIYMGLTRNRVEASETDISALHAATEEYTKTYPNSPTFRAISIGPEDDPLQGLAQEVQRQKDHNDVLADIAEKVRLGELPLGMLSELGNGSSCEISIRRAAGIVQSHDPKQAKEAAREVADAMGRPVALDITAAVTLGLLDRGIVDQLTGIFTSLESTDHAFRDVLAAQEALQLKTTLSVVWSESDHKPVPVQISEEAAERLATHADNTAKILTATNRRGRPSLKHFNDLPFDGAWLSTLDLAIESKLAFWSDDRLLCAIARQEGVAAFGTIDILRELKRTGRVQSDIAEVAEAVLVANYHVDVGFSPRVMRLAAEVDGWRAGGAACALGRPFAWENPAAVMEFLNEGLSRSAASPASVQEWVYYAAKGLVSVSADDPKGAAGNLGFLLGKAISQPWMSPDLLPFVLSGVRDVLDESPGVDDPLDPILRSVFSTLLEKHGAPAAAQLLLMWVKHLREEDRQLAAKIILTAP